MKNSIKNNTRLALTEHHHEIKSSLLSDLFRDDPDRFSKFSLQCGDVLLDYSRNHLNIETLALFKKLTDSLLLTQKIDALFTGKIVNSSENRPALHTALRDQAKTPLIINNENIATIINDTQTRMRQIAGKIHAQEWLGCTGKPITHIVNIGIGGSYAGSLMATDALRDYAIAPLTFHYLATVDDAALNDLLTNIDPETTLFIIASKSFATLETLTNANSIYQWMTNKLHNHALQQHFIAITAANDKAHEFGIASENILPMWDWVGGRFSLWSAIGLPLLLMIGVTHYDAFLNGAYQMDKHFRNSPIDKNIPIILACIDYWYIQFFGARAQAIIPYSERLRCLIPYLQQLLMESNGKNINTHGDAIPYMTSSIIIGEEGCRGQHAYHQLLHQGSQIVPADFILIGKSHHDDYQNHQAILIASGLSQAEALMRGKTYDEAYQALIQNNYSQVEANNIAKQQVIAGNRPSHILYIDRLTPKNLGMLLALYEHRVFVQSVLWDINPFDQWGVELGKQLLPTILDELQTPKKNTSLENHLKQLIKKIHN